MKIQEYMKMVNILESGEYIEGESFEDLIEEYEQMGMEDQGGHTSEQKKVIEKWKSKLEQDCLDNTVFRDKTFLAEFLKSIPEENQFNYVENTNNYFMNSREGFDPKYVIVTRRAVPSIEPKPEQFWSTQHMEPLMGLRQEIPIGPHRQHSIIMVSTLQTIKKHGMAQHQGGHSDGEICISSKPFTQDEMLFVYKPFEELYQFISFIRNGGMKNVEVLQELRKGAKDRAERIKLTDEERIHADIAENKEDNATDITTAINPALLKQKLITPNGEHIPASRYVQEYIQPLINIRGRIKLKTGAEISGIQYVEEFVLGEGQLNYNGDIEALMRDTLDFDALSLERDSNDKDGRENAKEQIDVPKTKEIDSNSSNREGLKVLEVAEEQTTSQQFKESLETSQKQKETIRKGTKKPRNIYETKQTHSDLNNQHTHSNDLEKEKRRLQSKRFMESLKPTRKRERTGTKEVNEARDKVALTKERRALISKAFLGTLDEDEKRRLEELNKMLNIKNRNIQQYEQGKNKAHFTGQTR